MRRIARAMAILSWVVVSIMGEVRAAPLTDEEKRAFKWYDALGFPRTDGSQWVHVATGHWSQRGGKPPENHYINAFLLKAEADRFTVFTTSAETLTFVVPAGKVPEHQRVGFDLRDLEQDAQACLEALRHPGKERDQFWERFGERLRQRAEVFILARACAARGLGDLAHDLCVQAETMSDGRDDDKSPLLKRLSDDFAYQAIWKAFLDFENPKIGRSRLLGTFRSFIVQFPDSEYTARARETAEILDKMVKEDEAHARAKLRPLDQMPVSDRVAELIFQLRDQNGHQWGQPGGCDIFDDDRREKSPAAQLVAIGLDAVPQLIEAMNDDRFTRSVGYARNFFFSHYVLRVGDCAGEILTRTAHRSFMVFFPRTPDEAATRKSEIADTQRKARQWWADVQKKGEMQVLAEAVASGGDGIEEQAAYLAEKYPDAALAAIIQGFAKSKSDWTRLDLVDACGTLKGNGPLPFLTEQLNSGPTIDIRVAAARALVKRGRTEAVAAMIVEWNKRSDAVKKHDAEAPKSLVEFLVSSDDPAAIHAIKEKIRAWDVDSRLNAVEEAGFTNNRPVPGPATLEAIEEFLIAEIDDTEERGGMTGTIGDDSYSDPRVCDMAAHSLAARWKKRYSFRFSATLAQRDRQRVIYQNAWRARHNLPLLPLPVQRKIQSVAREKIDPLLHLLASPDESARKKAAAEIEALGLGALPALREAITALPADDAKRKTLELLARRLSCRVTQIDVEPADAQGGFKTALDALKGKSLTTKSFIGVLSAFAKDQPQGIRGIRLYAIRGDDLTGILIRAQMVPGKSTGDSWDEQMHVAAGGEALLGSFGGDTTEGIRTSRGLYLLPEPLAKALNSPPEAALEVRVSLLRY